jgi:hypothetical protein
MIQLELYKKKHLCTERKDIYQDLIIAMPGEMGHTYNPSTGEVEAGGFKFKTSLSYIMRPCLKKTKGGDVAQ